MSGKEKDKEAELLLRRKQKGIYENFVCIRGSVAKWLYNKFSAIVG